MTSVIRTFANTNLRIYKQQDRQYDSYTSKSYHRSYYPFDEQRDTARLVEDFAMLRALLTNIQTIAQRNKPINPSKSPFFDQKWGKNAGFLKNTDRARYKTFEVTEQDHAAQIHDRILVMHKTPINTERGEFLSRIADESRSFLAMQRAMREQAALEDTICQTSMTTMMDHLFEIFKAYAYELNNAVGFSQLHMAATNPQSVTEVTKFDKMRNPLETVTHQRARLSTSRFSLVLKGDKKGIEFFIIPVDKALGLSRQEVNYGAIFAIQVRLEKANAYWETHEGKPLTSFHVESICMELFHTLVEATKAQVRKEILDEEIRQRRAG